MRRSLCKLLGLGLVAGAVGMALFTANIVAAGPLAESELKAKYAVGIASGFIHDHTRPFDVWGEKYGSPKYQELLKQVNGAGVPATIPIHVFYPTPPSEKFAPVRAATSVPTPLPAAKDGKLATLTDLYFGNKQLANHGFMGPTIMDQTVEAYKGAPVADGQFPLLIGVHGGGGGISSLSGIAQRLASQGYIAVVFAVTADGMPAPIFDDPQSPFVKTASPELLASAYEMRANNGMNAAFRHWFVNLYQYNKPFNFGRLFGDPTATPPLGEIKATKEGAHKNAVLMQEMFTQRLADVSAVIREMKALNKPDDEAKLAINQDGFTQPLIGKFTGHIDTTKIGVFGHSLGGMTAQVASAFLEDVDASVSLANGMQRNWEPNGGFPNGAGTRKPALTITGSQDFAVHMLLRVLHWKLFEKAGGDMADNFRLPSERKWPTEDNPLPESMAAYERATGPKMYVTTRNQDHFQVTDDFPIPYMPGEQQQTFRIPTSIDVPLGQKVDILGWVKEDNKGCLLASCDAQLVHDQLVRLDAQGERSSSCKSGKTAIRAGCRRHP